ncbi:MAG: EcoKI restriction-modification system protein HsdS [Candidatus Methanofastidiosum methylothiophilum]|uniref:EcoKI restriction-modification system protein HsdS n=1 Tax=Candidatus Methanofastidiosum methylothiophilum TaxID=1705564 RepID=A0A150J6I6_9EURY|nr:MAG: EcoKI restriction-modification system protein HsdS [Candidatus Methanofastidiosum methylthiophilus]
MISEGNEFKESQNRMTKYKWRKLKIGDTCFLVKNSYSPTKNENKSYIGLEHIGQGTLKLVGIGNSEEIKSVKLMFKSGNILFGKLRPYFRKVYMPNFDGVCSTDFFVIQEKKEFDNKYLFYFFSSWDIVNEATKSSEGTRMPRASWEYLSNLKRIFPPLPDQKVIAKVLSDLDDKIELNNEMNKTLEEIGQILFRRWFTDFEFPDENGNPYQSSGGEMIYSRELGKDIPKEWKVEKVRNIIDHYIGGGWGSEKEENTNSIGSFVIRGTDFSHIKFGNVKNIPFRYHKKSTYNVRCLKPFDFILEISGGSYGQPVGRTLLITPQLLGQLGNNAICASFCKLMRLKSKISPFYFDLYLNELYSNKKIMLYQQQSTGISNFNFEFFLDDVNIFITDEKSSCKMDNILSTLYLIISKNRLENQFLSELRDTLLPKLMSGEIRVPLEANQ